MRITAITITLLTVLASTTGATPIPPPSSTSNTELQPRQLGNTFQDQGFKPVPPQSGGKVVKPWDPPEGKCIGWGGVHLLGCVEKIKRSLSLPTPWNPPEGKCVGWAGVKLIGCDEKAKRKESDEKVKRKEFCYSAGWWRYGTEGDCKLIGT